MKIKFIFLVLAVILAIPARAQNNSQHDLYQRKVEKFSHLRNAGWTMTGFGAGLVVTGTVLLATLPSDYWYDDSYYYGEGYNNDPSDDAKAIGGIISLGLGIGLLAGGITMGSIGSRKVKQYQGKLNNVHIGVICTPKRQGLMLTYRF